MDDYLMVVNFEIEYLTEIEYLKMIQKVKSSKLGLAS